MFFCIPTTERRSLDLQAYNLTVNAENLHVTLDLLWTQHDFVDYCDVFVRRDTGLRFLGRCFSVSGGELATECGQCSA